MRFIDKNGDQFTIELEADELHIIEQALSQSLLGGSGKKESDVIARLDAPRHHVRELRDELRKFTST